jgi:histidinol-phosphatase (PHP family)
VYQHDADTTETGGPVSLPPDNHIHSEWSWDAVAGDMEATCARAVELGLPSIAFTEHIDYSAWYMPVTPERRAEMLHGDHGARSQRIAPYISDDNLFRPPPLNVEGYLAGIERCRDRFPGLRILTGVELGEPHVFAKEVRLLLAGAHFDRRIGSLHTLTLDGHSYEATRLYESWPAELGPSGLVRTYLTELARMVEAADSFEVLAHIDYTARRWPAEAGPFDTARFAEEFRAVLTALARTGRVLEVNTRLPLDPLVVRWWFEVGGEAVSFGSDAHLPSAVGHGFEQAAAMAEAHGFRPGRTPLDFWTRRMAR